MWYSKRLLIPLTLLLAVLTLSCGESDENGIPTRPGSAPGLFGLASVDTMSVAVVLVEPVGSDWSPAADGDEAATIIDEIMFDASAGTYLETLWDSENDFSVAELFEEMSYGALQISGTVLGPYVMSTLDPNEDCGEIDDSPCDKPCWQEKAIAQALTEGYDLETPGQFQRVIWVTPNAQNECGGQAGEAAGGEMNIEVNAWHIPGFFSHELGHRIRDNFLIRHADDHDPSVPSGNLGNVGVGYRDLSCVMGSPVLGGNNLPHRHFHGYHKVQAGWVSPEVISCDVSGQAIAPLAATPGTDPQVLRVDGGTYSLYLSYRYPVAGSFDGTSFFRSMTGNTSVWGVDYFSKVLVQREDGLESELEAILDATNSSITLDGITIDFVSSDSSGATVDVTYTPAGPTASFDENRVVNAGLPKSGLVTVPFDLHLTNNSCGAAELFSLSGTPPTGFSLSMVSSISVGGGQTEVVDVALVYEGGNAPEGVHTFSVTATHATLGSVQVGGTYVADRTDPYPPSTVTQTVGNPPTIAWNAADGTYSQVTEYRLYRNGGGTPIYTGLALEYEDTGAAGCTTVTYQVKSVDEVDRVSSATNLNATSVDAPTNLADATASAGFPVTLTWDAVPSNGCLDEYVVYRDGAELARTTNTYYQDASVSSCSTTLHDYEVFAENASSVLSIGTGELEITIPYATSPSGLTLGAIPGVVNVSWSASTATCGTIDHYEIERQPWPSGTPATFTSSTTSYNDATPTQGQWWKYKVRAVTSGTQYSDWTAWKKVYVPTGGFGF